jgi:hypothetical protein
VSALLASARSTAASVSTGKAKSGVYRCWSLGMDLIWNSLISLWNVPVFRWVHLVNIMLYFGTLGTQLQAYVRMPVVVNLAADDYVDFRSAAYLFMLASNLNAVNLFLCYVQLFEFLHYFPRAILTYTAAIAIIVSGSAAAHMLVLGPYIPMYRDYASALFSMIRTFGLTSVEALEGYGPSYVYFGICMFVTYLSLLIYIICNFCYALFKEVCAEDRAPLPREPLGEPLERIICADRAPLPTARRPDSSPNGALTALPTALSGRSTTPPS